MGLRLISPVQQPQWVQGLLATAAVATKQNSTFGGRFYRSPTDPFPPPEAPCLSRSTSSRGNRVTSPLRPRSVTEKAIRLDRMDDSFGVCGITPFRARHSWSTADDQERIRFRQDSGETRSLADAEQAVLTDRDREKPPGKWFEQTTNPKYKEETSGPFRRVLTIGR